MKRLSKEALKLQEELRKEYGLSDKGEEIYLETIGETYDIVHKYQAIVDKQGPTIIGERGQIKAHPLLSAIRDARSQFLMALKALNLDIEPLRDKAGRPPGK